MSKKLISKAALVDVPRSLMGDGSQISGWSAGVDKIEKVVVHYEGLKDDQVDAKIKTLKRLKFELERWLGNKEWVGAQSYVMAQFTKAKKSIDIEIKKLDELRKKLDKAAGEAGLVKTEVSLALEDYSGRPMDGYRLKINFSSPGTAGVERKSVVKNGAVGFLGVMLQPEGTLKIEAGHPRSRNNKAEGVARYTAKNGKMSLLVKQKSTKPYKAKARSLTELQKKTKISGSIGADFDIVKVNGQKANEKMKRQVFDQEVEWQYVLPTNTLQWK